MKGEPPLRVRVEPGSEGAAPGGQAYEVLAAEGLLDRLDELLARYAPAHRYALVSDETVGRLYGSSVQDGLKAAGLRADLFTFPAGEAFKTRRSWAALSDEMLEAGVGRDAAVVALGGGVTGDLAGFVAATFMRGVPLVQIPTSLLAMIDSSVGGKTGVDTPAGKNLIGAFLHPRVVLVDARVLATLSRAHVRAGLAEAIKHGAIADAGYLEWIEASGAALLDLDAAAIHRLVLRSVEIKAAVVGRDEREEGLRKVLNFGHTVGHALEHLTGYRLLHGEAISIGMVLEARIGERIGVTAVGVAERLEAVLARLGLPTRIPGELGAAEILSATRLDKKSRAGRVEYALLERMGASVYGRAVPDEVVIEVLAAGA